MLKLVLNNLPESVIAPPYDAYEVDTFLDSGLPAPALFLCTRAEKLLFRACNEVREYRVEPAIHILEEALLEQPGFHDAELLLGILHASASRLEEAEEHLNQGLSVEAHSGELIRRFLPTMRMILRISRFHFFPLYPDYYGGSLLLAAIHGRLGEVREAVRVLHHLRDLFGTRDEERVLLAEIYLDRQDYENALSALEREQESHRDDLDTTLAILKGYCELMQGKFHQAAKTLKSEVVYSRQKNPYLTTVARFLYSEALEEDGLPVLALKESAKLNLKYLLNPQVAEYVKRREENLRHVVENLHGEAFFDASEFRWFKQKGRADSEYMEVLSDEYSPEDGRDTSWERPGIATVYERLYRLGQQFKDIEQGAEHSADAIEGAITADERHGGNGTREPDIGESAPERTYEWSVSTEGNDEFLRFDFRGTRKTSGGRTTGERRLAALSHWGLIALLILILAFILRACL